MRNGTSARARIGALSQSQEKLLKLLLAQEGSQSQAILAYPRDPGRPPVRLPSSWAQQRLWFIEHLEGAGALYNLDLAVRLHGPLNAPVLSSALNALVQRHETLRTTFVDVDGELQQQIGDAGEFDLQTFDLSGISSAERDQQLLAHRMEEAHAPFDLVAGPLIRGRLLRLQSDEYVLLITMHHIVSDGWSLGVFMRDLAELYSAGLQGRDADLPPMGLQYADYAQWQREWLSGKRLDRQLDYWRSRLTGTPPQVELPTDRPRPPVRTNRGASVPVRLDGTLTGALETFGQRHGMTLFMVLYGAWALLLARVSGQEDIVIGTPVANRRRPELEGLIGFFVNTLVLRADVAGELPLSQFLNRIKETTLAAYDHQDTPFEQIVEALKPPRSRSYHPLFQVMFALQNAPKAQLQLPGLSVAIEESVNETAKFDLLLSLEERDGEIVGKLNYALDLFDAQTMERWIACFNVLLENMLAADDVAIGALPLLPETERHQVIEAFNATHLAYPRDKLIHELFEAQVARTPEAVAVIGAEEQLTYAQLNARANQLARYLRGRGVGPECFVGLCIERGVSMVVGLLAILKAGGAYVPLDPSYPEQRLGYMLADTRPKLVITQQHLQRLLPEQVETLALDAQWREIGHELDFDLEPQRHVDGGERIAYVIFTSGSTGQPKGVVIEHRNAVNLIHWAHQATASSMFEQTLFSTSLNFDLSVYECFVPLTCGGAVRVVQNALVLVTEPAGVTLINTVPSAIKGLLDAGRVPETVRVVNLAGEALKRELVERIFSDSGVAQVSNLYGPSETTTYSTWVTMSREQGFNSSIGRPIANTQIYILNAQRQPVPIGVVGEIYIGGAGVARGYLNKPELTQERFLHDPFSAEAKARMYKTGDLGRWRADGTIEYLGRNDHQVKIRGFRIELGEIEAQLMQHPQVREAVVLAREDVPGEKRLVGYVVPAGSASAPIEELRVLLKASLPDYMAPSAFVMLEQLPLTSNGKLDRRALPAPDQGSYGAREYQAPQGQIEAALAEIWQSLLGIERVGRNDNFFELGGHSLLIVQLLERLRRVGLATDVSRIFESPSLAALASALTSERIESVEVPPNLIPPDCESITPQMLPLISLEPPHIERIVRSVPGGAANIQDLYPLAPLQEGILFHHLMSEGQGDTYVLANLFCISSRARLDDLSAAFQTVIDRHDVLRSAIYWEHLPQPVQVVYRRALLPVDEVKLDRERALNDQLQDWLRPERQRLDLRRAPLMRLQVAADPHSTQWYALLQLHHIVGDGESLRVVIAEVVASLQGHAQVSASTPYRAHVAQAVAYARRHDAERFFRSKLGDVDEPTAPFGLLDVHGDGSQIDEAREALAPPLAARIRGQARRLGVSAATLFHAAWGLVVAHSSGRDDVVFGSVLIGRMQGAGSSQRMLGMFINTLPLRLQLQDLSAAQLIQQTQRELVELLSHEQASLAVAQRCSAMTGTTPLFSALFNYRHSAPNPNEEWSSASGIQLLSSQNRTNYPITLSVDDLGEGFALTAQTDRRIDPKRMTGYLRCALESLMDALEEAPPRAALALSVVPVSERQEIAKFNATERGYRRDRLIHELFESQVQQTPDAIAAVFQEQQLTYAQLNARANRLARRLRESGVGPGQLAHAPIAAWVERKRLADDRGVEPNQAAQPLIPRSVKPDELAERRRVGSDQLVGICVDRSLEMLVGLLGILKAGGAYVPLDPNYPADRLQYMMADAAPSVVLTQEHLRNVLPSMQAEVIALDSLDLSHDVDASVGAADLRHEINAKVSAVEPGRQPNADLRAREPGHETDEGLHTAEPGHETNENLSPADLGLTPEHLLYVIYTSGSTGRPKGTAMSHGAMVNLIEWHREHLPATNTRVLQFAALSFDVAFQETFSTLCTGGTLVMLEEWVRRDARALMDLLHAQSVQRLFVPPLMLQSLAEQFRTSGVAPSSLRDIITAGEQLRVSPEIIALCEQLPGCRLHNHYGPTETHVVTALTLTGDPQRWPALPSIGAPIANTQMYVLDRRRQPVPLGAVGEVYIGGVGLARGYLHRPELAAERFIADPFSANRHARMYRTGDLGRWRADGTLEYLGRNDDQVKLRGYRIELGEIEAQLARHPQVREAAVIVHDEASGGKRLVAYVTPRAGAELSSDALRAHLKDALPDYMVPSAFVTLAQLPLTPSGKLNRRALPAPDPSAYASTAYEAPKGEIEQSLAAVWQQLLHVPRIGRDDNFFELGGHSLLVLKALYEINRATGCELRVTDIYKCPTVRELAARIDTGEVEEGFVDLARESALDPAIVAPSGTLTEPARAVLLTGATGFVGRHLLAQLLRDTDANIYCLVRASSEEQAMARLRVTLAKWDLWREEDESRIVAVQGDLRLPRLGMSEGTFAILARTVDAIYHCATSMNHLETYSMAKAANVDAAKQVIRLATLRKPKSVNYMSTLGVFSARSASEARRVNEHSAIDREKHSTSHGYVASKWVAEKIFMQAAARGIQCNIFRLGLMWADAEQGRYDELQRGYRILKSSLMCGVGIKDYRYEMPPTPVDYAARAIVYLAARQARGSEIFHISSSDQMREGVFESCNEVVGTKLRLVSFYDWIRTVEGLHHAGQSLPVVPLVEFAFSMDEQSFSRFQRSIREDSVRFDCSRTHRELERGGIVAPIVDQALLKVAIEGMVHSDADLRASLPHLNLMSARWSHRPRRPDMNA